MVAHAYPYRCFMKRGVDVVHIISGDQWAGAEAQVFHTLVDLRKQNRADFQVILFNNGVLRQRLLDQGIETVVIDETKHNAVVMLLMLAGQLRRSRPAIIHVHAFKEHILGQAARTLAFHKSTIVRTFHGMSEVPQGLSFAKHVKSLIVHKIEKWFLNSGANTHIIAVSKDLEGFLHRSYPKTAVTQIYNGIPHLDRQSLRRKEIRSEFGIGEDTFWIGTFARLTEPKNIGLLIDAGKELALRGIDFRISIFGAGPLKEKLQGRIYDNNLQGRVRLEGFKEQIIPILGSIDLFVLCSLHEGLPISLLEAMSLEVPVVCTEVGGIKEVITHNQSGLLVPSNDRHGLAAAILKLREDEALRRELASNAKRTVAQSFSVENANRKLTNIYQTILRSS